MEIRGGGPSAQAQVLPEEAPRPGPELHPGPQGEEPAAAGLLPGRRRGAAATSAARSRCPPEGPERRHGAAHSRQPGPQTRQNG